MWNFKFLALIIRYYRRHVYISYICIYISLIYLVLLNSAILKNTLYNKTSFPFFLQNILRKTTIIITWTLFRFPFRQITWRYRKRAYWRQNSRLWAVANSFLRKKTITLCPTHRTNTRPNEKQCCLSLLDQRGGYIF